MRRPVLNRRIPNYVVKVFFRLFEFVYNHSDILNVSGNVSLAILDIYHTVSCAGS